MTVSLSLSRDVIGKADRAQFVDLTERLTAETLTAEQLREHLAVSGYPICTALLRVDPATGRSRRNIASFVSAHVVGIDVDHGRHAFDSLRDDPYLQQFASFAYTTPSHTAEQSRYRIVFLLETAIDSPDVFRDVVRCLSDRYDGDQNARDPVRLWYGSPAAQVIWYGRTLPDAEVERLRTSRQTTAELPQSQDTVALQTRSTEDDRMNDLLSMHSRTTADDRRLSNSIAQALLTVRPDDVDQHLRAWELGTADDGRPVFWYRDVDGDLRHAETVDVDAVTGRLAVRTTRDHRVDVPASDYPELTTDDLRDMLRRIPAQQEHIDWKRVVAGVFRYFGCDDNVCSILDNWSTSTIPYRKLYATKLERVGIGTVVHIAKQHGYTLPRRQQAAPTQQRRHVLPLYGEQFVGDTTPDVPVLLVDDERTAVVASMFWQSCVVVAIGPQPLSRSRAQPLAGRDVCVLLRPTGNVVENAVDVLSSVGARPVVGIDGDGLQEDDEIATYLLENVSLWTTAENPQLTDDLTVDVSNIPSLDIDLSNVDLTVDVSNMPSLDVDLSNIPSLDIDLSNMDHVRTSLLRAFGRQTTLPLDELNDRIDRKRIAGGRQVVRAACDCRPPLLKIRHDWKTYDYYADLLSERGQL